MTASRSEIARRRREFIASLVEEVRRSGRSSLTAVIHMDLDDPDEHPIREAARMEEEIRARIEGRRPHLEKPCTLASELKSEVDRHGWTIEWDPATRENFIVAPLEVVKCPSCDGGGRMRCKRAFSIHDFMEASESIVERSEICSTCKGVGRIVCRKDLAP